MTIYCHKMLRRYLLNPKLKSTEDAYICLPIGGLIIQYYAIQSPIFINNKHIHCHNPWIFSQVSQ